MLVVKEEVIFKSRLVIYKVLGEMNGEIGTAKYKNVEVETSSTFSVPRLRNYNGPAVVVDYIPAWRGFVPLHSFTQIGSEFGEIAVQILT